MSNQFQTGDKVRTITGEIRTVLFQRGLQVFIGVNEWAHPGKLDLVG